MIRKLIQLRFNEMIYIKKLAVFSLCFFVIFETKAENSFIIDVGSAKLKKSLLAIPTFIYEGSPPIAARDVRIGKELFDVLNNDLSVSGFFEFIKPQAFIENSSKVGIRPASEEEGGFKFESWKQIGAEFLIRGAFRVSEGQVSLTSFLYFVPSQKKIIGRTYTGSIADVRRVAHTFANDIVKELTGLRGFFTTRLAATRTTDGKIREVFIMDWDGANQKQISKHNSIAVSPTWNSKGNKIIYSAFVEHKNERRRRNLDLFVYELDTMKRILISYRKGINSGAAPMPNDAGLLITLSNADSTTGNTDIYRIDFDGKI